MWLFAALGAAALLAPNWLQKQRLRRLRGPEEVSGAVAEGRPVYRHSVVAGGVYSAAEVRHALARDPVVARHYAPVRTERLQVHRTFRPRDAYLSYRVRNAVYWTRGPMRVPEGEQLLSDGRLEIRARCGNRISETPQRPVSDREPPAQEFESTAQPPDLIADGAAHRPWRDPVRAMLRTPGGPPPVAPPFAVSGLSPGLRTPGGPAYPYRPGGGFPAPGPPPGDESAEPKSSLPEPPPGVPPALWPPPIGLPPAASLAPPATQTPQPAALQPSGGSLAMPRGPGVPGLPGAPLVQLAGSEREQPAATVNSGGAPLPWKPGDKLPHPRLGAPSSPLIAGPGEESAVPEPRLGAVFLLLAIAWVLRQVPH